MNRDYNNTKIKRMSKDVEENKKLKGDDTNDKKRAKISSASSNKSC